ncbi:hypothetical protein [Thalassobacter stenotrophicus]|uniref:hypothetical protein n=2 Tax=Thalassobacter stenotrophicus TaxID=266809 RepID=UPI00111505D4|nr:hypothetical protein [Thalassobacter stenotrophicus]
MSSCSSQPATTLASRSESPHDGICATKPYYTENTPYEQYAHQLAQSLDHYGLPHRIEPIQSLGSWVANTGLKAAIIEKIWNESDRPICWIDADAEIIRTPSFVFGHPFDVSFVRRYGWYDLAGFIYLNKSEPARQLITEWARLCRENQHVWDQVLLSLAWYRTAQSFDLSSYFLNDGIFRFPRPYIRDIRDKIFYYSANKKIKPFINQKQASRKLKEFINSSRDIGREYTSNDIGDGFKVSLAEFKLQEIKGVTSIFR